MAPVQIVLLLPLYRGVQGRTAARQKGPGNFCGDPADAMPLISMAAGRVLPVKRSHDQLHGPANSHAGKSPLARVRRCVLRECPCVRTRAYSGAACFLLDTPRDAPSPLCARAVRAAATITQGKQIHLWREKIAARLLLEADMQVLRLRISSPCLAPHLRDAPCLCAGAAPLQHIAPAPRVDHLRTLLSANHLRALVSGYPEGVAAARKPNLDMPFHHDRAKGRRRRWTGGNVHVRS